MIAFVNILPLLDKLSIYLLFYYINIIYSKEKIINAKQEMTSYINSYQYPWKPFEEDLTYNGNESNQNGSDSSEDNPSP